MNHFKPGDWVLARNPTNDINEYGLILEYESRSDTYIIEFKPTRQSYRVLPHEITELVRRY